MNQTIVAWTILAALAIIHEFFAVYGLFRFGSLYGWW